LVSGLENRKVLVCPTAIALALGEMMLNADKYGQDVEVKIIIHDCEIVISVVSIGPIVCSSRIGLIGRRGVRGENVNGKPGSGQGLALVKELAESMGGKFEFTSIPTRENGPIGWTTVTCILPVSVV
jgi:signal transduction histidine kinase